MARKKPTPQEALINAAFDLAADMPWRDISLSSIAEQAKVPLDEALAIFADKNAILDTVITGVTDKAIAECRSFSDEDTARDRLFALLMARLDAMAPYKKGAKSILRGITCDPAALLCRLPHAMTAMAHMLEAAGVDSTGLGGIVRTKGLFAVFAGTVRVWLDDDTEDLGPTMAALDRNLGKAEMLARQFSGLPNKPTQPVP